MGLSTFTSRIGELFSNGLAGLGLEGDSSEYPDRRAYTRVKVRFEGSVDFQGRRFPVQGIDLHRGGTGIRMEQPLPVGALVFFFEKKHGLMGWATVRWCSSRGGSRYQVGLEFRSALMRAEAGDWQFSFVQTSGAASAVGNNA
jgi:hypothetical protein